MHIFIVRHGETPYNAQHRVCGETDLPLTEKGQQQAREMAEKIAQCGIQRIIVSPMLRARQTAAPAAEKCGLPIQIDERIREMSYGTFEGTDVFSPEFQKHRRHYGFRFPGGESYLDMISRTYQFLDEIKEKYADERILLVCHGGICRAVRTYFENVTNEGFTDYKAANGEIREYKR